jgi:class 3 adenylate cyclase
MDIESHQAAIVLVDIGGYTRFIKFHDLALVHAERIITELLGSVIDAAEHPLTLNKLEGDAALFFALADRDAASVARSALSQVAGMFPAFHEKRAYLARMALCTCSACQGVDQLRIKAIVHCGEVALKKVRHFEELAGQTVIAAHRLLKNSVQKDEYVLVTEVADRLGGGYPGQKGARSVEQCDGIGPVPTVVYDPPPEPPMPPEKEPLARRVWMLAGLQLYVMARRVGLVAKRNFPKLAGL